MFERQQVAHFGQKRGHMSELLGWKVNQSVQGLLTQAEGFVCVVLIVGGGSAGVGVLGTPWETFEQRRDIF